MVNCIICYTFSDFGVGYCDYVIVSLLWNSSVVDLRRVAFKRTAHGAFRAFICLQIFLYILLYVRLDQLLNHTVFCCFE